MTQSTTRKKKKKTLTRSGKPEKYEVELEKEFGKI